MTAAVSGFYFGHPESQYFGVARIGSDQLEDYAQRRGVDIYFLAMEEGGEMVVQGGIFAFAMA